MNEKRTTVQHNLKCQTEIDFINIDVGDNEKMLKRVDYEYDSDCGLMFEIEMIAKCTTDTKQHYLYRQYDNQIECEHYYHVSHEHTHNNDGDEIIINHAPMKRTDNVIGYINDEIDAYKRFAQIIK